MWWVALAAMRVGHSRDRCERGATIDAQIVNSLFYENASSDGGAIRQRGNATYVNTTIVDNSIDGVPTDGGAGILVIDSATSGGTATFKTRSSAMTPAPAASLPTRRKRDRRRHDLMASPW